MYETQQITKKSDSLGLSLLQEWLIWYSMCLPKCEALGLSPDTTWQHHDHGETGSSLSGEAVYLSSSPQKIKEKRKLVWEEAVHTLHTCEARGSFLSCHIIKEATPGTSGLWRGWGSRGAVVFP